jgi:CRISPR-associated protein Csx3
MMFETSSRWPAVLIGGPPHAGKSVLARSLKRGLLNAHLQFYGFSTTPDGEGDWSQDAAPALVQAKRRKGEFTSAWVEQMCRDIASRPLPFLIDVGGKPEPWQRPIFDYCTHAILLVKDTTSAEAWQTMMAEHNVPVIALLTSQLEGVSVLHTERPVVQGIITNLKRGQLATGPVFEALLARLKALFNYDYDYWLDLHQKQAPIDLVIDLRKLYYHLYPARSDYIWQPQDIPDVLNYLPRTTPFGLYGIGPGWLYTAVARYTFPTPFYLFDARRGWVSPFSIEPQADEAPVEIIAHETETYVHLNFILTEHYLNYQPQLNLPLPALPDKGVILESKGPNWLYASLARFYHQAPWLGVYQPQPNQVIITFCQAKSNHYAIGETFTLP